MITMAIDASTRSTGVAIFDGQKLIHTECITASSTNVCNRIRKIVKELMILVDNYKIDEVALEEVLPEDVKHNQTVFKALMYLQAAIALDMNDRGKEITFYVSSAWRKKCGIRTGRGVTREMVKAASIKFAKDTYNIEANDDICDAIGIGYAHTHRITVIDGFEFG